VVRDVVAEEVVIGQGKPLFQPAATKINLRLPVGVDQADLATADDGGLQDLDQGGTKPFSKVGVPPLRFARPLAAARHGPVAPAQPSCSPLEVPVMVIVVVGVEQAAEDHLGRLHSLGLVE